jgi:hypothetical protein
MLHPTLHTADAGQAYEVIENIEIEKSIAELFPFVPDSPIQKTLLSALCTAPRLRPLLAAGLTIHCVTERCSSQVKCELA